MKKQIFILSMIIIPIINSCMNKQELSSMEDYLDKNYSICIGQNEQIANRLNMLINENKVLLEPLEVANPKLEKTEFCYEFYGEKINGNVESSTLLVFDFVQNTIALAYKSSYLDSIIYLMEDEEKIPMPIHFLIEEEFLNNQ